MTCVRYATSIRDPHESDAATLRAENKLALDATIEALETVQPICLRNSFGQELQQTIPTLKSKLVIPVVAMVWNGGRRRNEIEKMCVGGGGRREEEKNRKQVDSKIKWRSKKGTTTI